MKEAATLRNVLVHNSPLFEFEELRRRFDWRPEKMINEFCDLALKLLDKATEVANEQTRVEEVDCETI